MLEAVTAIGLAADTAPPARATQRSLWARVVTVCHYPTGCSKWNPIELRLFSQISLNWAGKPLRSLETMLNYIRGTTTQTGLTVRAALLNGTFEKGQKVSDDQMRQLNIEHQSACSQWNYTIQPRLAVLSEAPQTSKEEKVIV
jgi:hypothetical protein